MQVNAVAILIMRLHQLTLAIMNKTQFYLSQCANAASKSQMCFTLGAIMVKGGKVISSGHNHHRPHYDGAEVPTHGHRKVRTICEVHSPPRLTYDALP